ncbi:alsin isoform X2 [Osmerus mordax]|uniref:alsin isoform X2 n=1 Tax=Osmerus mordax TaxID=8014 RepID=UPI0035100909
MLDENKRIEEERSPGERGLLHLWRGCSGNVSPECPLLSRPVLQVSLGACHGLLLAEGGLVYSWGDLSWRQGLRVPPAAPLHEDTLTGQWVVSVAAGSFHSGAVTEEGAVYMWGENNYGQCGVSERGLLPEPTLVSVLDSDSVPPQVVRVTELSCGEQHTLALSVQREVWAWGSGCQLGLVSKTFPVLRPQKVEHLSGRHVIQLACGAFHSLALVRSLPSQDYVTQKTSDKCGQCKQLLNSHTDYEDHSIISDSHYCPLGVELESGRWSRQSTPKERLAACRLPHSDSQYPESVPGQAQGRVQALVRNTHLGCPDSDSDSDSAQFSLSVSPYLLEEASQSPSTESNRDSTPEPPPQEDGSPGAQTDATDSPPQRTKLFSDNYELKGFCSRLSDPLLAELTDSTTGEALFDGRLSSSYEEPSPVRTPSSLYGSAQGPGSVSGGWQGRNKAQGGRRCVEESFQGKKSASLADILLEDATAANRRRSLPGAFSHASPVLPRGKCRRGRGNGPAPGVDKAEEQLPSLANEVWSWGRGQEGQLGHGDHMPRLQPLCIKTLNEEEVVRVAAGTYHSVAITAKCQVFSWGSNMSGQLGHMMSPTTRPQQAKISEGIRVWDVAAGQSHSLFLADGDCIQPVLCYGGQRDSPRSAQGSPPRSRERSSARGEMHTVRPILLPFCMDMGYVSSVGCGGQSCAALADHNVMGFIGGIHELAASERKSYCMLADVHKRVLCPLLKRVCSTLGPCSQLFQTLGDSFSRLCQLTGQHSVSLTSFLRHAQNRDITGLLLLQHSALFLNTYKEYCGSVGNFQVMGGFQAITKLSVECFGKKLELLRQLSDSPEKVLLGDLLVSLCYMPLEQLHQYSRLLLKLATCFDVNTEAYQRLQEGCSGYEDLSNSLRRKRKEAENTCLFWKTFSGRTTDSLRLPRRRLLCETSNKSLTLQNAGRFSVNWFILFNDALVHAQFSSHHVYPLAILWVEPVTQETSSLYGIKVTTPEESFTLLATSPQEKAKWLRALNQAVEQQVVMGDRVGVGGVPAVARSASYTFTREGRLKDATYSGRWLTATPHGRGTMKWPDGRTYTGTFRKGLEDGYGDCLMPNKLMNKPDRYLGQWREGRIHGFGTYRYASGEVYEGSFHDTLRQGHGMLSSGKLARSSSSVFVGQWLQDKRTGYGVFDDITKGEKYMGMWLEDQRQGSAVVVTQFGLYYEGTFSNNKMTGTGLLVVDDDTSFQGEFSDDWILNGKGTLSMPNGDHIEGQFSGEWATGLKIEGRYTKPNLYMTERRERACELKLGRLAVPADQKWKSVFEECWRRLDCDSPGQGDPKRAWEKIAVTLTTGHRNSPELLSRSQRMTLEQLEVIPQHVGPVTTVHYNSIRRYLSKACETPLHPLGCLLETLVTAYRMTYVGVGSNRRLLRQAVEEIRSYLTRIFQLVRFLFPDLPEEGTFIPECSSSPASSQPGWLGSPVPLTEAGQQGCVVSSSSLLLPVLLPRLYPPLFTLYCLHQERQEADYWDCVIRLNKQSDQALLAFLGVQERFWPVSVSVLGEQKQVLSSTRDACFASAVETLQQLSTTFTPSDKLLVIHLTFRELKQEVQTLLDGNFLLSMDDLLPLSLYVVLRARIRNLGAEVSLIEDLMEPCLQHGELGLMFTTLQACYVHIQREKTT